MGRRILMVIAALAGGLIGGFGSWIFHFILDANGQWIISHNVLAILVGSLALLFFAKGIYGTKIRNPRSYGLLVLGIACGIFIQAIIYFENPCPEDCKTDFVLKLAVCMILMVDGFSSYYRQAGRSRDAL
jgi:hypothetical protein